MYSTLYCLHLQPTYFVFYADLDPTVDMYCIYYSLVHTFPERAKSIKKSTLYAFSTCLPPPFHGTFFTSQTLTKALKLVAKPIHFKCKNQKRKRAYETS